MILTADRCEERRAIDLQGNRTLTLEGQAAWRVESGSVAVFAVERLDGHARGRRRHLFDLRTGDVLLGMNGSEHSSHVLVAVPLQAALLTSLESGELAHTARGRVALDVWNKKVEAVIQASIERDFFRALEDLDRQAAADARSRLDTQHQLGLRLSADTVLELAGSAREGRSDQSPLLNAAHAVGEAQGIRFRGPDGDQDAARDPVQTIALASGIQTRSVLLNGAWWTEENGALLAHTASNRRPVALIPSGGGRYHLVDPADGSRQPVDAAVAATLDPDAHSFYRSFAGKRGALDLLRFALRGCGRDVRMVLLCMLATTLLGMVTPLATALLFAHAIPDADRGLLVQIALGMVAAVAGSVLFDLTRSISAMRLQTAIGISLAPGAWDWLLKLSPAFFRRFSAGDLRARVDGFSRIHEQLRPETQRVVSVGVTAVLYLGLMLHYSVALGLLAAACGAFVIATTIVSWTSLSRLQDSLQQMEGSVSGLTVQLINAVPKLRIACAEQRAFGCWSRLYSRKQRVVERVQAIRDRLRVVNMATPTLAVAFSFSLALRGDGLDLGTFLAFNMALGVFMHAMTELSDTAGGLVSVATHWRRAQTILDAPPEVDAGKASPGRLGGRLALDHVTFLYRTDGRPTLEDVSIHANPGECIALVGPSGSGKSTILDLMLGFETPASGSVLFDGRNLSGLDLTAVRRQIGVVRQDSRLMSQSIFDNIVCGSRFTLDEAWTAARGAGLAEDIQQMPMGMHTIVSEGGANLSGGQRQRLLIARALILTPRVLLFDEATSALDNRTQRTVTESVERLKATRVIVAHRLSTIRHADRIYVIERGRVVQQGTFDELAMQPGLFLQLMKRQMM